MSAKKAVVIGKTNLTAEEIERQLHAKGQFRTGTTNSGSDGSRRLVKGETDRQPMLRGSQGSWFR